MDFDAHHGERERARDLAFLALKRLRRCGLATILEESGSGGWHLWVIAKQFKPAREWISLLKGCAQQIGTPIVNGICEIFPPDTLSPGLGKPLRAPGSWNPRTGNLSKILWHDADKLISELAEFPFGKPKTTKNSASSAASIPIEKEISLSGCSLVNLASITGLDGGGLEITACSTRHAKVTELVTNTFRQLARPQSYLLAQEQFESKSARTNADLVEHLKDFNTTWESMEKLWLASITELERQQFAKLATDSERSAFRIIHNFSRKAVTDEAPDFPIGSENLAKRLGITLDGAVKLRNRFVSLGILRKTAGYQPHRSHPAKRRPHV